MHTYIPAVSALSLFSPRLIALKLFSIANSISLFVKSPSGPMAIKLFFLKIFLEISSFLKKSSHVAINLFS